ncbi:uncharacterized protein LOC116422553 [Sarcophilus harrisii]|uniref:uncharacterized protein LOC116422553 n=1 Tax=Sarcophilus harrisii TaxID=9305 RepID=UPI001301C68E|nr:uncharacterized protein LOC116422553 [Sarcophilus harrisii]
MDCQHPKFQARFPRWMPSFFGTRGNSIRKKTTQTKKAPKLTTNYSCSYASQKKISQQIKERNNVPENFPKFQPKRSYHIVKSGARKYVTKEAKNEKDRGTMRNLGKGEDRSRDSKDHSNLHKKRDNGTATTSASSRARFPRWMPSFFRTRGNSIRKKTTQTKKTPKVPTNYSCNYISQEKISEKVEERNTNQENFPKCQPETSHNMVNRGAMKTITKQEINDKYDGTMRNLDQEEDLGHESQDDSNTENDNETATTSHRAQEKKFTGWIPSFLGTLGKRIRKRDKRIKKAKEVLHELGFSGAQSPSFDLNFRKLSSINQPTIIDWSLEDVKISSTPLG